MDDLIAEFDNCIRRVADGHLDENRAHVIELRRRLRATITEVWDACTDPERIRRWFLPVSGDLRAGGHFQFEGNAGGTIVACQPPRRLEVTWELGEAQHGVVTLELDSDDDATELVLRHTVPDDDQWAQFGPGAVGVGWDLPLAALAVLLSGKTLPAGEEIMADPRIADLMRQSATAWGAAHQASGVSVETAREAARQTSAFYAPEPEEHR